MNSVRHVSEYLLSVLTLISLISIFISAPALATNGYFTHGLGTKNKAMAGAGTASPDEALAAAVNPAAAVIVGDSFDMGMGLFSPRRSYNASTSLANGNGGAFTLGAGSNDSDSNLFGIPYIAGIWMLDETSALSVNFYGRGGMNTDYSGGTATFDPDGPGPAPVMTLNETYGMRSAGVDLNQGFIDVTYAWKLDSLSLGVSGVFAMQAFEARGLGAFAGYTKTFASSGGTTMPTNLTNNGHEMSYGWGLKLGVIWEASDQINLAFSYQSKSSMSEFDDYSDLFAEDGGFDIPSSWRAGISWKQSENLNVHFDVEEILYTDVDSVSNSIDNIFACPTAGAGGTDLESCMGGSRGPGFGWDDMTVYKLGFDWNIQSLPGYRFRSGFSHTNQPIGSDQVFFNILAPGVIEDHLTFGVTKQLQGDQEMSLSLMYGFEKKVQGRSTFDPTQTLEIKMHQWELEFGYRW